MVGSVGALCVGTEACFSEASPEEKAVGHSCTTSWPGLVSQLGEKKAVVAAVVAAGERFVSENLDVVS